MKIVLIPDKFKGSLEAIEVLQALTKGILRAMPGTDIRQIIASDGGDGFLASVANYIIAKPIQVSSLDPLSRPITASYLLNSSTGEAFIEMAKSSGMELLTEDEQSPLYTSTVGTGILIKDAIAKGAKKIYVGLGGSATNDGGIGIAAAMGYVFLDANKNVLPPTGENLLNIKFIQTPALDEILKDVAVYAINDVNNPLFGEDGAAYVYAPQKGAGKEEVRQLDNGLRHLHKLVREQLNKDHAMDKGSGAAGGTAFGLKTFLSAEFISGTEFTWRLTKIEEMLQKDAIDLIITGEGKIDSQTMRGKLIHGVLALGMKYNIPVLGICGQMGVEKQLLLERGLEDVLEIKDATKSLSYTMQHAASLVENRIFGYFNSQKAEN